MKTAINKCLLLVTALLILVFVSCHKDDDSFGQIQTDLKTDTVYKATSDGFLTIQFESSVTGTSVFVKIFCDNTSNPATLIGQMTVPGTVTLPIKNNYYWKVMEGSQNTGTVVIQWTPLQ